MQDIREPIASRRNPLLWIGLIMVGLILFVLLGGDRELPSESTAGSDLRVGSTATEDDPVVPDRTPEDAGTIDRGLLIPPGMRAREYIAELREQGQPYPLDEVRDLATGYQRDGSLADAYLLYFFAAREGHARSMLEIGRLNDPRFFKPENALLDEPDALQAMKWYRQARQSQVKEAATLLDSLQRWAENEAASGNEDAQQILLNFR